MPYPGNGFSGGSGGSDHPSSGGGSDRLMSAVRRAPIFSKTENVSYGTSSQIYSLSSTAAVDAPSGAIPNRVDIRNTGPVPCIIMVGYKSYDASEDIDDSGADRYFHTMLMPGESYQPNVRGVISTATATAAFDGTSVENQVPASVMYTDSTADVDHSEASTIGSDATHTTLNLENGHSNFFRVGDLIRIEDEICEVTAVGTGADLANSTLTIIRGVHGSTAATHADDVAVRFPFFNSYHDFDKYSVAQTDDLGRFKCTNFFGQGRASSGKQGLVPGSVAFKFYTPGYRELGLSGITSSTNSGLTASTTYAINITVDGGSEFVDLSFITDSSNLRFGGTSGIISRIQAALDTQYYTAGNLFEKKVTVGIIGGDIRFTSGSRLSTSAITLANPASGASETNFFGNGRIPAIGNIDAAIAARLPDDVAYDRITYATSPTGVFCYDDGRGILKGMCSGTVNYETGAIDMRGPANAQFVYTVSHTSAFSGKLTDATTARGGALVGILVNNPSQKRTAKVALSVY